VITSIAFGRNELRGSPLEQTHGHLVVVCGRTERGDYLARDPAAGAETTGGNIRAPSLSGRGWATVAYLTASRRRGLLISLRPVDLALSHEFRTSRSRVTISRSYYLSGGSAVGEASPVRFYGETPGTLEAAFHYLRDQLPPWGDPRAVWAQINRLLGYNFALKCGLDLLYWDHWGQAQQAPVYDLLGIPQAQPVCTAFSIASAARRRCAMR